GLRATGSRTDTDRIYLNSLDNGYLLGDDLGWLPLSRTATKGVVLDLSGQLDQLQGGQLNVALQDDTAVDWAVLNLKVVNAGGAPGGSSRHPVPEEAIPPEPTLAGDAGAAETLEDAEDVLLEPGLMTSHTSAGQLTMLLTALRQERFVTAVSREGFTAARELIGVSMVSLS